MKFSNKYIKTFALMLLTASLLTTSNLYSDVAVAVTAPTADVQVVQNCQTTRALDIVNSPKSYLNKTVTMQAKFDKFSTLGLDYKPAMRSSEEYISFLIQRDDSTYDIPLSEMKLFMKRAEAEKFIDLKTDDVISVTGKVFSDALGDAWIDVEKISIIKKAPEKDGVK